MINPLIALLATPVLVLILFAKLRPREAVLASYLTTSLFLPIAGLSLPGLPSLDKMTCPGLCILMAVVVFDFGRLSALRPRWYDLPMVTWCLSPLLSSLSNGLGIYDGLSGVLTAVLLYAIPYLMGRLYLSDADGLRAMAMAIVVGGLVYAPLCLFEVRMSPQLHKIVYGYYQHSFVQSIRMGGYRPTVFMQHGLEVAFWMAMATLTSFWFWIQASPRDRLSWSWKFVLLLVTTLLCRSTGAIALMLLGLGVAYLVKTTVKPGRWAVLTLMIIPPMYMVSRSSDWLTSRTALDLLPSFVPQDRAASLKFRLDNEDLLINKAQDRAIFGWGGWGRSDVYDDQGHDLTTTDGLWIIYLGQRGLFGLTALTGVLLLPSMLLLWRWPTTVWRQPDAAAGGSIALVLGLYTIDCLFNAMLNPVYFLAGGALAGAVHRVRAGKLQPWIVRGRLLKQQGNLLAAAAAWRHAIAMIGHPGTDPASRRLYADLHNDLAWLLCCDIRSEVHDPSTAARLATMALEAAPDHPAAWNTLGMALYRCGDSVGAVQAFERSIDRDGGDAFDCFPLAMAHRRRGDEVQARERLDQAIAWTQTHAPSHPELIRLWAEATSLAAEPRIHLEDSPQV